MATPGAAVNVKVVACKVEAGVVKVAVQVRLKSVKTALVVPATVMVQTILEVV